MFHGTMTQVSIMKTLTKHQIAGNKSLIICLWCVTLCVTEQWASVIGQKLALLEFTRFHCETVVVVCFLRLCSAVLNKSRHWVKKLHPNVCSIRLVNNKTKKGHWLCNAFYMELFWSSVRNRTNRKHCPSHEIWSYKRDGCWWGWSFDRGSTVVGLKLCMIINLNFATDSPFIWLN